MTPESQRIAIAEACGWKIRRTANGEICQTWQGWRTQDENKIRLAWRILQSQPVPDYLNDLNACHEMEKVLTDDKFSHYGWTMLQSEPNIECRRYLSATAAQRCEAFLRALNLWHETR
jgi:hypothetical protein